MQGLSVGIGATMLFHCDLVYAGADAGFVMPFAKLGLVPEAGASLLAPARLGHARAARMLLLGEPMGAVEAGAAGFVTEVVPVDRLLAHGREKAACLAAQPAGALEATRRLMKGDTAELLARIEAEATLFAAALQGAEARQAISGFFARR